MGKRDRDDVYEEELEDFEDFDALDDIDFLPEEEAVEEERQQRAGRLRVAAGVMDFLSVAVGMVAVLALAALLLSLVNWLAGDVRQMFSLLQRRIQ